MTLYNIFLCRKYNLECISQTFISVNFNLCSWLMVKDSSADSRLSALERDGGRVISLYV